MKSKKDDIFKKLFRDKEIFLMLLKDFVKESWVKEIDESKIKLEDSLYPDGVESNRESDIIYKVNYKREDIFVFILLEHQSNVNYLMTFRILEYMMKLWRKYIDEAGQKSKNKSFKLPPIFPIIFYDGINNWTAVKKFSDKIVDSKRFKKYIPDFEYDIINLNDISFQTLESYEDLLSAILLIDKIKKPEDLGKLKELGLDYWHRLQENVKEKRALEKIAEAMNLLLNRIKAPKEEIDKIVNEINKGRLEKMFEMAVDYDVQETRRIAMEQGIKAEKKRTIYKMLKKGLDVEMIASIMEVSVEEINSMKKKIGSNSKNM
ncbi:MAG: Rpn family recombination-promoting nuclease/putative transposase [Fusobacteriota bacterium]